MKRLLMTCILVLVFAFGFTPMAKTTTLNYDPLQPAPGPVLGGGWASDSVSGPWINSLDSPYNINLTEDATFTITDAFMATDNYFVYDFGNLILTTHAPGGPGYWTSDPEAAIADGGFSWGRVDLGIGAHQLTVQSDLATGVSPAGFYTQLVPEPATICLIGLGGLALLRKRRA